MIRFLRRDAARQSNLPGHSKAGALLEHSGFIVDSSGLAVSVDFVGGHIGGSDIGHELGVAGYFGTAKVDVNFG